MLIMLYMVENYLKKKFKDTLVVTADAYGDNKNWSISIVNRNGTLKKLLQVIILL